MPSLHEDEDNQDKFRAELEQPQERPCPHSHAVISYDPRQSQSPDGSITLEVSAHVGRAAETEEHAEGVELALPTSSGFCLSAGVFEALWEAFLGCVVACTTWLAKRCLLRCSLWALFAGNSALVSLARSIFFFSTFIEGDNCLGEATSEGEEAADSWGD
ncbi:hypothetical protein llap_15871 [Limosa lapponica baueri]|uniref:Uncharacterized protein n=1 Tax=Limosa lapponica baueri TaxID=1758121 RepID=A0A2I0TJ42_LIMLA|nr:hypothetical protein llap_15871 [Limosa lapponica baueri]